MEVTNGDVIDCRETLTILTGMQLPIKVSLQVAKMTLALSTAYQAIEIVNNRLIETYGEPNEIGSPEVVLPGDIRGRSPSPKVVEFLAKVGELRSQTVEIEAEKIKLPLKVDEKPLQIAPNILVMLDKFIEVEE